jgi:RHH-type proline utilization regulon transcriptional repressor/proline dehydrogenase/delta 1-pyrroline-5-carboxylate dehydrogenase
MQDASPQTEENTQKIGRAIHRDMQGEVPGLFNRDYWQGRLMEWVLKDPDFKVDLFRFVDVLPSLKRADQISNHVKEYLVKDGRQLPSMLSAAIKVAGSGLASGLVAKAIRANVEDMAARFIVGESVSKALPQLIALHQQGRFARRNDLE